MFKYIYMNGLRLIGAVLFLFVASIALAGCGSAGRFAAYCLENPRNCD